MISRLVYTSMVGSIVVLALATLGVATTSIINPICCITQGARVSTGWLLPLAAMPQTTPM